jgi:uncharacterized protein DUF2652
VKVGSGPASRWHNTRGTDWEPIHGPATVEPEENDPRREIEPEEAAGHDHISPDLVRLRRGASARCSGARSTVGSTLSSTSAPSLASGPLVLADISGYTSFLQTVAFVHRDDAFADGRVPEAYEVLSGLLDGIVGRLVPPFTLSKLEGDAVFAYSDDSTSIPRGQEALDCLGKCYADFRHRVDNVYAISTCWCEACSGIDRLDLKFVLHAGSFVIQDIAGQRELVGPQVVLAHRLLKSRAADLVGHNGYVLVTDAAADALDIPSEDAVQLSETHDDEHVSAHVFALR